MPSPSNIYAEKVYSEHPLAMWALDDQLDYISKITEEKRNYRSWLRVIKSNNQTNVSVDVSTANIGKKMDSALYKFSANPPEGDTDNFEIVSGSILNFADFDEQLSTLSIGTYFYSNSEYILDVTIGFYYNEEITNELVEVSKTFATSVYKNWIYIAETWDIPNFTSDVKLFMRVKYAGGGESSSEYEFYANGLTVGQWSEEFQSQSLGLSVTDGGIIPLPSNIPLDGIDYCVAARSYGLQDTNGYYIISENALSGKNTGMPMVFGANNVTSLTYSGDIPALIVPGNGFLNEMGRHKTYTFEMWLKIDSITVEPHRIFGPISSTDGLYVDNERLYIKINDKISSFYVTEWYRPLLIDIVYTPSNLKLLVNAEEVASIDIDSSLLSFPSKFDGTGKDQDWIGFYPADDISPLEVDCISIYGYEVSKTIAKRRFIYGQNVEFPEIINSSYGGQTAAIDYSYANYSANFVFPQNSAFKSGIGDNVSYDTGALSSPTYELPDIVFDTKTSQEWYSALTNIQNESDNFFRFRPNGQWSSANGYLHYDNLSFINGRMKTICGIFKMTLLPGSTEQILFKFVNKITKDTFTVSMDANFIYYRLDFLGTETLVHRKNNTFVGEMFVAGLDIIKMSNYFGGDVQTFFSNVGNVELFIGGDDGFENMFLGHIYRILFANTRNGAKLDYLFANNGVPYDRDEITTAIYDAGDSYFGNDPSYWNLILDGGDPYAHALDELLQAIGTYNLVPKVYFGNFMLDILTNSTWEDYVPLSHFAKYVKAADGGDFYDLDFIQFNIAYPAPGKYLEQQTTPDQWSYAELQFEYGSPTQYAYKELDNYLFSGYADYADLQQRTKTQYVYDTTKSGVRTYVTFQYLSSGANTPIETYTSVENVSTNNLVKAGDEWVYTKYEVVDGTVIYPPRSIDFKKLAIVLHVEMNVDGILTKPVSIKRIELASQALSSTMATEIGTRFGVPIYPYTKSGIYFNYKDINPFRIYKRSTPYLYLSRTSGIELVGDQQPLVNRGITIPINQKSAKSFNVSAIQILARYNNDFFPYSSTPIFEIESKDTYIKFYLVSTHPEGKRAKIYAINTTTGLEENGIAFYINGKLVKNPTITVKEWSMIGISFADKLIFDGFAGAFRVNGPLLINNFSHYRSSGLQERVYTSYREWKRVMTSITNGSLSWDYWNGPITNNSTFTWNNVLIVGKSSIYGINMSEIFKSYIGTNRLVFDDNAGVKFAKHKFMTYKNIVPVTYTKKPV
jgi:hypothetical protein